MQTENPFYRKGYDAYLELKSVLGRLPTATDCPARRMPEGDQRSAFIRGWVAAQKESK